MQAAVGELERSPMDSETPRLRTLLLTDLVGSTDLVERLGDMAASDLFREHDRAVLSLQQRWHGRLIDRSDGLLLLFERPIDGLGFALDYLRALRGIGHARGIELQARAGLHVGEVLTWNNSSAAVLAGAKRMEVEGLAKSMAARLMGLARPGQILLSAVVEPLVHRAARELGPRGEELLWKPHGRWRFKGLPQAQEVYEVGEMGSAPLRAPASTAKAWRDIPLWRRPAALALEMAVLVGAGIVVWYVAQPRPAIAFAERDWVVVGDLHNLTGDNVLDDSLQQAFRISLEQSRYVNVLSDLKVRDTLALMRRTPDVGLDRGTASEIALRDGARAVILPTVAEIGGRIRVSAEVIDPNTQTTVYTEAADGKGADSVLASIDGVAKRLRGNLGEAIASIEKDSRPLPEVSTANLDALRAYALGEAAYGQKKLEEAKHLYQQAIELDPHFALAYLGLLRVHWYAIDYAEVPHYLEKALALRDSLPPRDRLYLDAWKAEVTSVGTPLQAWRTLATIYPDYFVGLHRTSWYLIVENRFQDALPYAAKEAVAQNPAVYGANDMLGRIHLALGQTQQALESLLLSERQSGGQPNRRRADALAVLGRYEEAWRVLDAMPSTAEDFGSLYTHLDRISVALDQGRFEQAARSAAAAFAMAAEKDAAQARRFRIADAEVALLSDPQSVSAERLQELADTEAAEYAATVPTDRLSHAMSLLAVTYLAQRAGHAALSARLIERAKTMGEQLHDPVIERMIPVLDAMQLRLQGEPAKAVQLLSAHLDGSELVQAHSVLAMACAEAGEYGKAIEHSQWLLQNRGRAYVENNLYQLLQPLNVADTRMAHLWLGESQAKLGDENAARGQQAAFFANWAETSLPDYLRRRALAMVAASKS